MKKSNWGIYVASATEKNTNPDLSFIGQFVWFNNKIFFSSKKETEIIAFIHSNSMWQYEAKRIPENLLNHHFKEIEF